MGFLRTGATVGADVTLVVELAMGVALLYGMRLARQRRFRSHARCQAAVMLLNLIVIAVVMIPSFRAQVFPNLHQTTSETYYALPLIHAALGTTAQLLGLYVLLVAFGARVVPLGLRFHNFRAWMRTTLVLWWITIGFGVATYVVWYMAAPAAPAVAQTPLPPAAVTITMRNFEFDPPEITVPVGTTVTWVDELGRHTVETADGVIKSDTIITGQTFQKTFDKPGTYEYFCSNHGAADRTGMVGRVIVTAR